MPQSPRLLPLAALLTALAPTWAGAGEPVSGESIASAGNGRGSTPCVACHGPQGQGTNATATPRLAGLPAAYLTRRLQAFADGTQPQPIMAPIAKTLSDEEFQALAEYYANLAAPFEVETDDQADVGRGKQLAVLGSWQDRALPACEQCHGPEGRGAGASFPPLLGQPPKYLAAQIAAWQSGTRPADAGALMHSVARRLSADETRDVAGYYALLTTDPTAAGALQPTDPPSAESTTAFRAPPRSALPDGPFGDAIRRGEQVFLHTDTDDLSKDFVGNGQQCADCHLDAGRLADASPLWAAWVAYPAWRAKNAKVNTFIERIQGCFAYSMNAGASKTGHPPGAGDPAIVDLISYAYWLANGAAVGNHAMPGRGYPKLADAADGFDPSRGAKVYADRCALCHGAKGEGLVHNGAGIFPPLWGDRAYNWGAGMHRVDKAAAFIKHNMPLGRPASLSDQEAWDVAAYINHQPRPQDPRFDGDTESTRKRFHDNRYDYYGHPTPTGNSPVP